MSNNPADILEAELKKAGLLNSSIKSTLDKYRSYCQELIPEHQGDAFYRPTRTALRPCFLVKRQPEKVVGCTGKYYRVRPKGHTKGFRFVHESRVYSPNDVSNKGDSKRHIFKLKEEQET